MILLSLSILGTPVTELATSLLPILHNVDFLHIDIMDGSMTPIVSYDPAIIKKMREFTSVPLESHLYVKNQLISLRSIDKFGSEVIVLDHDCLRRIICDELEFHSSLGLYVLSKDEICSLRNEVLESVSLVNIVTVESLEGGQTISWDLMKRTKDIALLREENGYKYRISVDGGVNLGTIRQVLRYPVDQVAIGTAILKAKDPVGVSLAFRKILDAGGH